MKEMRCKNCGKKLGVIAGKAEIKCPRCGEVNTYDTVKGDTMEDWREYKSEVYIDDKGFEILVSCGISAGEEWGVFRRKATRSLQRIKTVPMTPVREEAEMNLRQYARKKKWRKREVHETQSK